MMLATSASRMRRVSSSSFTWPTSGIMISGSGVFPSPATRAAAARMARVCIRTTSGIIRPRRTPRMPSMGFCSRIASTEWSSSSASPSSASTPGPPRLFSLSVRRRVVFSISSSADGRNSWSGGSMRRITTGRPSIARKRPAKSSVWRCWSSASAASKVATISVSSAESAWPAAARRLASVAWVAARIMRRTVGSRSSSKNMCSVRHRPIPCAPKARARSASRG